jgi:hypothetical protein
MLIVAFFYRSVYTILGGYITATLAPEKPMRLVYILAGFGTIGGIVGVIAGWNLSAHWYPIAILISAIPCTVFGGKLKVR